MTENDELAQIAADDALLTAIAAGESGADDEAAALLADIARTAGGLAPSDTPGGSGRRGRGRRGGLWGITLGVSIAVAAGGGLSAAATDRLPAPVQRLAVEVGQAAPPADASQMLVVPTALPAPSVVEAVRDGAGDDGAFGAPSSSAAAGAASSWWQLGGAQAGQARDGHTAPDSRTPPLRNDATAAAAGPSAWWASRPDSGLGQRGDTSTSTSSSPEPTSTSTPAPSRYPAPSAPAPVSPTQAPAPTPTPTTDPSRVPDPAPTPSAAATPGSSQHTRSGHPARGASPTPRATTPTHPSPQTRH